MSLIVKEKVLADMNRIIINRGFSRNDTALIECVENAEEADVKRGSWEGNYAGIFHCSSCGKEAYWDSDYGQQLFDFCPSCGADLR